MRAHSYLVVGLFAAACGGSAFSQAPSDDGNGGSGGEVSGGNPQGGRAGEPSRAGRDPGGSAGTSTGGEPRGGTSAEAGRGGAPGAAGEAAEAGTAPVGGEPGAAGEGPGPDPVDEACPAVPPPSGGACAKGLACSYGDDVRAACRVRATCDEGTWQVASPKCPALGACDKVVIGSECDANAADCLIQNEIFCTCTACTTMGLCGDTPKWQCAAGSGGAACPKTPPNQGQACMGQSSCAYGGCAVEQGVTATCNGSTWDWQELICIN